MSVADRGLLERSRLSAERMERLKDALAFALDLERAADRRA